ncbi:MAG: hypothetical protein ACE5ES_00700 [Candidatus Nanoarchaeia archaeon]
MYSTVRAVRRKAGKRVKRETGIKIGTGDGSNKTFFVLNGFVCDGNGDGIIDSNDYTVYVDGTAVAVDAVFPDSGKIILNAAPINGSTVTIDYWYSDIPDSEIIEEIQNASRAIENKTRTKFDRENSVQEIWDGDGYTKTFYFTKKPVYEIVSYDVDGETTGLTEGEDYFLYPDPNRALWITFYTAPLNDNQNVKITYKYGEQNAFVSSWVTISAARTILLSELTSKGNIGTYILPDADETVFVSDKTYSLYRLLGEELKRLEEQIGGNIGIKVIRNGNQ